MLRLIQASRLSDCFHGLLFQSDGSRDSRPFQRRADFRKFFLFVFLTVLFVLLSGCKYDSTSRTDEGYLYNHVYLAKDYFGRNVSPGVLFRIKRFYVHQENGIWVYAEIINGPSPGREICVNDFGRYFPFDAPFGYPDGRTQPFWQDVLSHVYLLDPDAVEDLGELTDAELKEKGLWIEPFTEEAKALLKPLPEGIDLEQLQKDAENNDIAAQIQLGNLYYEGAGVRKSRNEAIGWLQKAADQGSRDAEFRLALVLVDAWRGADFRKAEEIFRKYAEQGDADAQFCLGLLLERGYVWFAAVLPKWRRDMERVGKWNESVEWYRKAADQGDARAMRALGMAYSEATETPWFFPTIARVEQDCEQAAEWFSKAAELGDFAAQRNLGYLYLKGKGVKKDKAEARKWLEKAAAQSDPYATDLLKELED